MAELELKEVSYFYESGGKRIDILDKASYSFEKGTLYTIVGPSGSGKTTTLTLAGALEEPKSGCVCFEGKDIREIGYTRYRNSKIGIVFQAEGFEEMEAMFPLDIMRRGGLNGKTERQRSVQYR